MRILVVGDSCKDVFVYGKVNRLTPEAPVPVFNPTVTKTNDGMARNVSNNVEALGVNIATITNPNSIRKIKKWFFSQSISSKKNFFFIFIK